MKGSPNKNRKKVVTESVSLHKPVAVVYSKPLPPMDVPKLYPVTSSIFWSCVGVLVLAIFFI